MFAETGFEKATLGTIASQANISRTLIYRYYDDKEILLEAVVKRLIDEWRDVLAVEAERNTPGTAHTLRLVLIRSLEYAKSRAVLGKLLSRDTRLRLSTYSNVIESGNDMLRTLVREILQRGVVRGDVRNDLEVEDLAHVVSEVFLAYADHTVLGDEVGLVERRIEAILETLLHGIITISN